MEELQEQDLLRKAEDRWQAFRDSWLWDERFSQAQWMPEEQKRCWKELDTALNKAEEIQQIDGYFPVESETGKWYGPLLVFLKKVERKLLIKTLGWYIFPVYKQQTQINGNILDAIEMQRLITQDMQLQIQQLCKENQRLEEENRKLKQRTGQDAPTKD